MHLFSLLTSSALLLASARALSLQRRQTDPDWMEAMNDFKSLVRAVSFGENIPLSHHEQPLQMMARRANGPAAVFILDAKGPESPFKRKNPFRKWKGSLNKSTPQRPIQKMAAAKRAATDEMALLNFLVALEEPNNNSVQVQQDLKRANARYQAIVNKRKARKLSKNKPGKNKTAKKSKNNSNNNKKMNAFMAKKPTHDKSKDGFKLDWKGARNKITLSVAFAVIVTALFCVVVQLFRLFVKPRSGSAYDQLNRRSAYGYERIALDVDEDQEAMPLAA